MGRLKKNPLKFPPEGPSVFPFSQIYCVPSSPPSSVHPSPHPQGSAFGYRKSISRIWRRHESQVESWQCEE